ncbi:MAG TPA: hypothetical protein VFD91_16135 [Mariniphaga sp.]|nr:hypothetical protein [Mariniphaga sp.]
MEGFIWGILYLLIIAFLITLFFRFLLKVSGPWGSFWAFFIIILLAVIAADIWISPIGPHFEELYWVPPIAAGLVVALLLAATTPSPKARSEMTTKNERTKEEAVAVALGTFFWFLIIFLVILIIAGIFIDS